MFSPHDPDEVLEELGDKLVTAVINATALTRADLAEFRALKPEWVAPMAERTLANFLHDRMWAHLIAAVGDDESVTVLDAEPRRELMRGNLRMRCKRHDELDRIATYPTRGARAFWGEAQLQIPGMEEIIIAVGYRWLREEREIGAALISYRVGINNPVWAVELGEAADGRTPLVWKPITDPSLPEIDLYESSAIEPGEAESP